MATLVATRTDNLSSTAHLHSRARWTPSLALSIPSHISEYPAERKSVDSLTSLSDSLRSSDASTAPTSLQSTDDLLYTKPALQPPQMLHQITIDKTITHETEDFIEYGAVGFGVERPNPLLDPRDHFVEALVGTAVLAVDSLWASSDGCLLSQQPLPANVLSLRQFIKETLRRSRSTCSILQTALYYLHKIRKLIRQKVAEAEDAKSELARLRDTRKRAKTVIPTPPSSPEVNDEAEVATTAMKERKAELLKQTTSPLLCGRRMFLAALILASKFLQDRNYSNRAWSKISGLPVQEVNNNEHTLLALLDYSCYVPIGTYRNWARRLESLANAQEQRAGLMSVPLMLPSSPSSGSSHSSNSAGSRQLARAASEYLPAPILHSPTQLHPHSHPNPHPKRPLARARTENSYMDMQKTINGCSHTGSGQYRSSTTLSSSPERARKNPRNLL